MKLNNRFEPDTIYEFIFDKNNPNSYQNLSNRSLRLFTDRHPFIKTGKTNLNFVFSTDEDIYSQWKLIYSTLPMLLTFYIELIDLIISQTIPVSDFANREKTREILNIN